MPTLAEVSPNEPDVMPDYVDLLPPRSPPPVGRRARAAAPAEARLERLHSQNAEVVLPEAIPAHHLPDEPAVVDPVRPEPVVQERTEDAGGAMHREGECIPNTPDARPDYVPEDAVLAPAGAPAEPEPVRGITLPSWLRRGYFVVTLVVISLLGILVFSQAINALALARTLPVWAQYLLLVPLGLCSLALLAVCAGLVHSWIRLRAIRQVDVAALEELRRRAETRRDGIEHFQAARASLEEYLGRYPLEGPGVRRLAAAGCGAAKLEMLVRERDHLVGRSTDSRSWLGEFRSRFQIVLDKTAAERVNSWSLKAAGCVMASPLPLLDAILILGISLKMIKDVATLYNARSGGMCSLVLLNRAIFVAFIAGVAEEAMDRAGEMLGDELSGVLGESALGAFGAGAIKMAGPKLGEGAINALFVRRLGRAAIRMLQPLRP